MAEFWSPITNRFSFWGVLGAKKALRKVDSMELNAKDGDPGVKSENDDEDAPPVRPTTGRPSLGRTPYHLSLSTTSTLSTGSSSSQARLVQVPHNARAIEPRTMELV